MKHKPKFHVESEKENKAHQMIKMIANMKLKQDGSGEGEVVIEGYASTSGEDRGKDVVKPTAFDINQAKSVIMLFNHDPYFVIGKTVDARADARGLFIKGRITSNQFEVQDNIRNGNLTKMSIGFIPTEFTFNDNGGMVIEAVDLLEISVVSTPMNEEAEFSVSKQLKAFRNLIQKDMDKNTLDAIHKSDEVEATPEVEATEEVETTEEEAIVEATETPETEEVKEEEVEATEEEACSKEGCTSECTKSTEEEATEEAEEATEEVEATEDAVEEEAAEETTEATEESTAVETKSLTVAKALSTIEALQKDSADKSELIMKLVEGINTLTEKLDNVTATVSKIPVNSASKTFPVKTSKFSEARAEVTEKAESMMSIY